MDMVINGLGFMERRSKKNNSGWYTTDWVFADCYNIILRQSTNRRCIDRFATVATNYNFLLQKQLGLMQMSLAHLGSKIFYLDVYNPVYKVIHDPRKFGKYKTKQNK